MPPAASPACSPHQRQREVQPLSSTQTKLLWQKKKKIKRTRRRRRQDPWVVALTSMETSLCRLTLPGILRRATRPRLLLSYKMSPGRKILNWGCKRINSWPVKVGLGQISAHWLLTQTAFVFCHHTVWDFVSSIKTDTVNYAVKWNHYWCWGKKLNKTQFSSIMIWRTSTVLFFSFLKQILIFLNVDLFSFPLFEKIKITKVYKSFD